MRQRIWIKADGVGGAEVDAEAAASESPRCSPSPEACSVEDAVVELFPLADSPGGAVSVGVDAAVSLAGVVADCSVIATSFIVACAAVGTDPADSSTPFFVDSSAGSADVGAPVFARLVCFCWSLSDGDLDRLRVLSGAPAETSGILKEVKKGEGKSKNVSRAS